MPNNKNYLITIALLSLTLAALIYLWQSRNTLPAQVRLEDIPLKLGEWKGEDIPISERIYQLLETKDVLMREYSNAKGERVVLAIVYSGANRGSFHPPEICYLGGGRELLNKGMETVELGEPKKSSSAMQVNRLLMQDQAGKEIAWYWFTAGSKVTDNYYLQQCYFIWNELRRNPIGGSLIRVSARAMGADLGKADAIGKGFIRQLVPVLPGHLIPEKNPPPLT